MYLLFSLVLVLASVKTQFFQQCFGGEGKNQPRPQGLLAFQNGGGSGDDSGTQQITCLQRGWRCIQNGGYGEKDEKNWVRDAKVKINKMAEKAEVQFKKKLGKTDTFCM